MVKVEFIANDGVVTDDKRLPNSVMLNFTDHDKVNFRVIPIHCSSGDSFTFAYESKPGPCVIIVEWNKDNFIAFKDSGNQSADQPKHNEVKCQQTPNKSCVSRDITFEILITNSEMGFGIENSENVQKNWNWVCPLNFESTKAFFNVTEEPKFCKVFLEFDYDVIPPPYFADNSNKIIRTHWPTTDLPSEHSSAFWVIVIGTPIFGILFLIGVGALIYGYCVIRKRRQKRRAMGLKEESVRTEEEYSDADRKDETTEFTLHAPSFQVKKIVEEEKKRQIDEREALVAVIKRLRNPKPYNWELKLNNGDQLDEGDLREKEITEAEWRWIHRRNIAFRTQEDHMPDPLFNEKMKALKEKKQFKEVRKLQTFMSRPHLYARLLDEEKMARKRHWQRTTGKPLCTESEMGVRIKPEERHISRPEPEPMNQDWSPNIKRMRQSKTTAEVAEPNKSTQPNSSGKETTAQTSEHTGGQPSAPVG